MRILNICIMYKYILIIRSPDYNHASPTSQMKFIYGNNVPITDEAPRSPKYTMYTTPSPNAPSNTNFTDLASGTLISSGQRSPKYLPTYENHQPISPRRSPNVPNKFVFDAVSPRRDSNGKALFGCRQNKIQLISIGIQSCLVYHYILFTSYSMTI